MDLVKKVWSFFERDVKSFFRREYIHEIVSLGKDGCNREVIEMRRYNKKTGKEVPYAPFPSQALAVCLGNRKLCYEFS